MIEILHGPQSWKTYYLALYSKNLLMPGLESDKVFILDGMGREDLPEVVTSELSADSREGRSYTWILEKRILGFGNKKY